MKAGDKVKVKRENIYGLKDQTGTIVNELSFYGYISRYKLWEVAFENHIGTYPFIETDLRSVNHQLNFIFKESSFL